VHAPWKETKEGAIAFIFKSPGKKPELMDAKGNPLRAGIVIYDGSLIRIAASSWHGRKDRSVVSRCGPALFASSGSRLVSTPLRHSMILKEALTPLRLSGLLKRGTTAQTHYTGAKARLSLPSLPSRSPTYQSRRAAARGLPSSNDHRSCFPYGYAQRAA